MTVELLETLRLAHEILDRVNADPDDDLAMLARQLVRQSEALEWYKKLIAIPVTPSTLREHLQRTYNQRDDVAFEKYLERFAYTLEQLKKELFEQHDPMSDLIQTNRDAILNKHEEAVHRVRLCLKRALMRVGKDDLYRNEFIVLAINVLNALSQFHPIHADSWVGWPEGS